MEFSNAPLICCKAKLKYADLWQSFHNLETEMIITKSGRRMFPPMQVHLKELDPQAVYCVFLEMVPASRCRYKYSSTGGWAPAGSEEVQSPHRLYVHPESPAKGEYWTSQPINFGRVKLTNTPAPPTGQIVLSSMHKYQPRIIIAQTSDPMALAWAPSTYVMFPETQFIAVTAYQNEKITQLKIDNNPFAKGFRQNGQAKCKRKRLNVECKQDEDEFICVDDQQEDFNNGSASPAFSPGSSREEESSVKSPLSPQGSPPTKSSKLEESDDVYRSRSFTTNTHQGHFPHAVYQHSAYFPLLPMPVFSMGMCPYPSYYQNLMTPPLAYPQRVPILQGEEKVTHFTDFSIKALLGC
ncbi:T-box transcription factor TBX2-like [Euwallacea fornicatus]|uniref:T-box transcription factor TBX2-like n=1 Tax=Euwallacea fornicatus TaxID=995702 RepID=UPI00338FB8D2